MNAGHPEIFTNCIIHQEQLTAKKMSPELYEELLDVIEIIMKFDTKHTILEYLWTFCEEMGSDLTIFFVLLR